MIENKLVEKPLLLFFSSIVNIGLTFYLNLLTDNYKNLNPLCVLTNWSCVA